MQKDAPEFDSGFALIGGERDEHGCLPAAGQSWSVLRQACIQPFDEADIRMDDPANATLAVYVLLSADRQQAELFGAEIPAGTVLAAAKGGYLSDDGRLRLLRDAQGQWHLRGQATTPPNPQPSTQSKPQRGPPRQ